MFEALKRLFTGTPKAQPQRFRNYTGARLGGSNVLATLQSKDAEIRKDLLALRRNSRLTANNNPFMRSYIRTLGGQVVGARGITLQSKAPKLYAGRIEQAWQEWGKRGSASACGRLSWVQIQRMAIRAMAVDGEVFVRRIWGRGPHGLALQFLDPDLLDHNLNRPASDGLNAVVMGIEVDAYGAPVAYHFSNPARRELYHRAEKIRIPAEDVWHGFDPERVNQTRGVPWTSSALFLLDMLGHYWESEVAAARHEAERLGFLTSDTADENDPDETQLVDTGDVAASIPGGIRFFGLPPGVKTEFPEVQHPTTAFAEFSRSQLKGIAAGLGVSYASISSDLTQVSYSSIRTGALQEREYFREIQQDQLQALAEWVFSGWFEAAQLVGALVLPADHGHKRLFPHVWQARGWEWVDPMKDGQAKDLALRNCTTSRTRILAEQGLDFQDLLAELQAEREAMREAGVGPESGPPDPFSTDPETDTEDTDGTD